MAGGLTYYDDCGICFCGKTHHRRRPLYWYSPANQGARFKQWDENQCDPCYFYADNNKCDESHDSFDREQCYPSVNGAIGCYGASPHATWYCIYMVYHFYITIIHKQLK